MANYKSSMPVAGATRQAQVSGADWSGGMNTATNQCGIGVNSGGYSPKLSDWALSDFAGTNSAPYNALSQYLGNIDPAEAVDANTGVGAEGVTNQQVLSDPTVVANDGFRFIQATGSTANGAELVALSNVFNRTGVTVPASAYVWGSLETP